MDLRLKISMLLRSMLIQAGWNYERMQNMGFCFALLPALRGAYREPAALKAAVLRHFSLFNTQPYMAAFILGNVARMEEKFAPAGPDEASVRSMAGVKQALASSFASIGDRIFWGRLKPLTTELTLLVWLVSGFAGWLFPAAPYGGGLTLIFMGPVAGMAVYSAFALLLRWRGLECGYACGGADTCGLNSFDWPRLIRFLSAAGFALAVAAGTAALTMLARRLWTLAPGDALLGLAAPLAAIAAQRGARAAGWSIFAAVSTVFAVSLFLFYMLDIPIPAVY